MYIATDHESYRYSYVHRNIPGLDTILPICSYSYIAIAFKMEYCNQSLYFSISLLKCYRVTINYNLMQLGLGLG